MILTEIRDRLRLEQPDLMVVAAVGLALASDLLGRAARWMLSR